jgi:alpha-glucosidase
VQTTYEMNSDKYLWWQTGVIYQIYPRSFRDASGNGVGDLKGIISSLDYVSDTLGVDAIWLSPFYPSPMADFGYDVADYTGVDPLFGDLPTFDGLLRGAHERGLRIIIDLVPNHSSDHHPWFVESRSSRDNAKRDWYVWANPKPDGSRPNNWLSAFGGPAWEWDEKTGQYYLHSFLKEQPDLNWRNPAVKEAMFGVVRFWLERGVDGFRVDVAHLIVKDPELRDNPPNPHPEVRHYKFRDEYEAQLHVHDKGHPDVHQIYHEFRRVLDAYDGDHPRMAVGEIHIFDWDEWARYYGDPAAGRGEMHMPFNFQLLNASWTARDIRRVVDGQEAALPPGAWPNYVLGNHDEPRLASRYGREDARLAAMLLLTLRGTPTLYYGDEIGMVDVPIPPDQQQDPWGLRVPGMGRDPCRTPMQWSPAPNAGFSAPETPKLWLPLAEDYRETNVERELADPASILSLYQRLLALRKASPALQVGTYQPVEDTPETCYLYLRSAGQQRFLIALNFSDGSQHVVVPGERVGRIELSTYLDREGRAGPGDVVLRAHEGLIVALN